MTGVVSPYPSDIPYQTMEGMTVATQMQTDQFSPSLVQKRILEERLVAEQQLKQAVYYYTNPSSYTYPVSGIPTVLTPVNEPQALQRSSSPDIIKDGGLDTNVGATYEFN